MVGTILELLKKNKKLLGGALALVGLVGGAGIATEHIALTDAETSTVAGTVVTVGGLIVGAIVALVGKGAKDGAPGGPGGPSA